MPVKLSLDESTGKITLKGQFGICGIPTSNNRRYGRDIIEGNVKSKRLQEAMGGRRLFGELDHPGDGKTSLKRVSHIITNLTIEDDGQVIGTAEPLPTPMGNVLKALAEAGCELGVSSRGMGSTVPGDDGIDEVQNDYLLKTYDFVADPATKTAYPKIVQEALAEAEEAYSKTENADLTLDDLHADDLARLVQEAEGRARAAIVESEDFVTGEAAKLMLDEAVTAAKAEGDEDLKAKNAELEEKNEKLKAALADKMLEDVLSLREDVEAEVRAALLADPEVAAAKQIVETIAGVMRPLLVPEKEREVMSGLKDQITGLQDALRDNEFQVGKTNLEMEELRHDTKIKLLDAKLSEMIAGHPKADSIRAMLGPVDRIASEDELRERVEVVFTELGSPEKVLTAPHEDLQAQVDALTKKVEVAESKAEDYKKRLVKAVEIGEKIEEQVAAHQERADLAEVQAYAARKVVGREDATRILSLTEGATSEKEVDKILRRHKPAPQVNEDEETARIRARIRRGREHDLEEETTSPRQNHNHADTVLGVNLEEAAHLAGIPAQ